MIIYIGIVIPTSCVDQTLGNNVKKKELKAVGEKCVEIHVHLECGELFHFKRRYHTPVILTANTLDSGVLATGAVYDSPSRKTTITECVLITITVYVVHPNGSSSLTEKRTAVCHAR